MNKPCLFCTFEGGRIEKLSPAAFAKGLETILNKYPQITDLAIGGGTPVLTDMGSSYFADLARVAGEFHLGTSVEMVPPTNLSSLDKLVEAGVASIIMSIELWDESRRADWCLGKVSVDRDRYIAAWNHSLTKFGSGRVASVLLVGAESVDSTVIGAKALIDMGVVPTLIPLRWYPDSRFANWQPTDPQSYLALQREVGDHMSARRLRPSRQPGCTACGGCSLEIAFERPTDPRAKQGIQPSA